jgi:hypothetical protein
MLLICLGFWWRVDHLSADNKALANDVMDYEVTLNSNKTAIEMLERSLVKQNELLVEQQQVNQSLQNEFKHKKRELLRLGDTDGKIKEWSDIVVPPAVSRLLVNSSSSDSN